MIYATATTIGDVLLRSADEWPDTTALAFPDSRRSYRELLESSLELARGLRALGVRRGDRVGILMQNCPQFADAVFGTALLGAVVVPLNARYKRHDLRYVVAHSEIRVLLVHDPATEYVSCCDVVLGALPGLSEAASARQLDLAIAPALRAVVSLGDQEPPGFVPLADLQELAASVPVADVLRERASVRVRDVAALVYTSGTTAHPKGCLLSHEGLTRKAVAASARYGLEPGSAFWNPLPLFHMSALGPLLSVLSAGGTYLCQVHFEAGEALEMIREYRATHIYPTFPAITLDFIRHPAYDPAKLDHIVMASAVLSEEMFRYVQDRLPRGATLVSTYGLTESSGLLTIGETGSPLAARAATNGRPVEGALVRVVDADTGAAVPAGAQGQIEFTGYSMFDSYLNDPDATARALTPDGWYRTGDIGRLDEAGRLTFLGREDDMLRVGGENVSPLEIEAYLGTHAAVKMAQVVGKNDDRYGEVIVAFIELMPGETATGDHLIDFCRGQLASFKIPREVHFVTEWPMSTTKIVKKELRRLAHAVHRPGRPAADGAGPSSRTDAG